jgi:hypothetical protein
MTASARPSLCFLGRCRTVTCLPPTWVSPWLWQSLSTIFLRCAEGPHPDTYFAPPNPLNPPKPPHHQQGIALGVPIFFATGSKAKAIGWTAVSGLAEPLGALIGLACQLGGALNPVAMGM